MKSLREWTDADGDKVALFLSTYNGPGVSPGASILTASHAPEVCLGAAQAREVAAHLLALADEIEGATP